MMDVQARLFALAGELEKYQVTGGHISPDTARWLASNLNDCGKMARHQADEFKRLEEQMGDLVEQDIANAQMKLPGAFKPRVIAGGRA